MKKYSRRSRPYKHRRRRCFQTGGRKRGQIVSGLALLGLLTGVGLFASRPAHTAGGPIPVSVANTPLATTTADSPAKQPFMGFTGYTIKNGTSTGVPNSPLYSPIVVPDGKRLVIQTVSVYRFGQTSGESVTSFIEPYVAGQSAGYYALPLVPDDGTATPGTTQALNSIRRPDQHYQL